MATGGGGKELKLFGVRIFRDSTDAEEEEAEEVMRKCASMGDLVAASSAGGRESGYLSDSSLRGRRGKERKRGVPWTEEEHLTFLAGLKKLGKGDWRGISRNFVTTRTPTQVASHAQKYFLRQNNMNKKRRSSLFDVVIDDKVGLNGKAAEEAKEVLSRDLYQLYEQEVKDSTPINNKNAFALLTFVPTTINFQDQMQPIFNSRSAITPDLRLSPANSQCPPQRSSASLMLGNSDLKLSILPPKPHSHTTLSPGGMNEAIRVT